MQAMEKPVSYTHLHYLSIPLQGSPVPPQRVDKNRQAYARALLRNLRHLRAAKTILVERYGVLCHTSAQERLAV